LNRGIGQEPSYFYFFRYALAFFKPALRGGVSYEKN
jgi:hypothetical protein